MAYLIADPNSHRQAGEQTIVPPSNVRTQLQPIIDRGLATGTLEVTAAMPNDLGAGDRTGSLDIRVCLNDATCATGQVTGSPFRVTVRYQIPSMLDADTVAPRVVEASEPGSLILRGRNFTNGSTVTLGTTAATAVTFVNSTELRVQYPGLAAGDHVVSVNGGAIPFTGTLSAVAPVTSVAAFVPFTNATSFPGGVVYDATRRALLMSVSHGTAPGELARYPFSGIRLQAPTSVVLPDRSLLKLSHDNSRLLALRPASTTINAQLFELEPTTLALLRTTDINGYARDFALANDGNLIFGARFPGSGHTSPIVFGMNRRAFLHVSSLSLYNAGVVASGDGSKVVMADADNRAARYDPTSSRWYSDLPNSQASHNNFTLIQHDSDLTGRKFRFWNEVFDENLRRLGGVPGLGDGAGMNDEGTRLYVQYHPVSGDNHAYLRTFDLTVPAQNGFFVELGNPIPLAGAPGGESPGGPRVVVTPDGGTVFVVGTYGIAVQPVTPGPN